MRVRNIRARLTWVPLFAAAVGILICGCRTTVGIEITQNDSAGGTISVTVELDEEALDAAGGPEVILVDDLAGTAWDVSDGSTTDDGGYVVEAERTFTDAGDLQAALDELAGPGLFTNVTSEVERGFAVTHHAMSLDASVTGDWAQFSDDTLTQTLGGLPVGYTPDELKLLGADQPGAATLDVTLSVPGGATDRAEFDLSAGGAQSESLSSASEDRDNTVIIIGIVGAALILIGLLTGVIALFRRRRRAP